jgi:outer membrane protein assembly factor BamD (BamD/ComL family)
MKKSVFLLLALFLISCGSDSSKEFSSLNEEALSQKIMELQNNNEIDKTISAINVFVDKYPESENAANYLKLLAAIYANDKNNVNQAITVYKKIINKYPESNIAPETYFALGFIYSTELKDYNSAKLYYTEFINKFPDHEAVESAKFEIQHLGKSEEEILNSLQNRLPGN